MTNQTNHQPNLVVVCGIGFLAKWAERYLVRFIE